MRIRIISKLNHLGHKPELSV